MCLPFEARTPAACDAGAPYLWMLRSAYDAQVKASDRIVKHFNMDERMRW